MMMRYITVRCRFFLVQSLIQFSVQDEMGIILHHSFFCSAEWNESMRKSSLKELYKREKKMARKKQIDCLYVIRYTCMYVSYYKIEAKKVWNELVILPRLLADEEEVEELLLGSLVLVGRRWCSWRMLSISASIGSAFRCGGGANTRSVTCSRRKKNTS